MPLKIRDIRFGNMHLFFNNDGSLDITFYGPDNSGTVELFQDGDVTDKLKGQAFTVRSSK